MVFKKIYKLLSKINFGECKSEDCNDKEDGQKIYFTKLLLLDKNYLLQKQLHCKYVGGSVPPYVSSWLNTSVHLWFTLFHTPLYILKEFSFYQVKLGLRDLSNT